MKNLRIQLLWFAFGVSIGVLVVLYGEILLQPTTPVSAKQTIHEADPGRLISLRSEAEAISKRKELIAFIWGSQGLPAALPDKIELAISDQRFSTLDNLKQIDRLIMRMEWGVNSTAYHFIPTHGNNKLLIYHQGHNGDFVRGIRPLRFFLERGFSVIALSMPLEAPNNQPTVEIERVGKIQLTFHEQLKLLEMKSGHPVQLFLTPVAISLNYAEKFGYHSVYMTGVSGGGWTTTMYAALDPRVNGSYPVAGTLPLHLRTDSNVVNSAQRSADWGDYEQTIPELYKITNYLELYVLGSYGERRRQLQVLNKYDPCCFSGDASLTYEQVVKERVNSSGPGNFAIYLDKSHKSHDISDAALAVILADTQSEAQLSLK